MINFLNSPYSLFGFSSLLANYYIIKPYINRKTKNILQTASISVLTCITTYYIFTSSSSLNMSNISNGKFVLYAIGVSGFYYGYLQVLKLYKTNQLLLKYNADLRDALHNNIATLGKIQSNLETNNDTSPKTE